MKASSINQKSLTFGFSPCPNDTFIFDALFHKKIDTRGYTFDFIIEDVEALNQRALAGTIDVTKLSFASYAQCSEHYILSNSGSALGRGCGPLLITSNIQPDQINADHVVGIPGLNTTANFLLNNAYPFLKNKKVMLFSEIEEALLNGTIDLGLIIHENRFTYADKGLQLVQDLGAHWEDTTSMSIPLGGIAIAKMLDQKTQRDIDKMIRESLEYAINLPQSGEKWIKEHAQEMQLSVMKRHIDLYVNEFSLDLGDEGRKSVEFLLNKAVSLNFIKKNYPPFFVN